MRWDMSKGGEFSEDMKKFFPSNLLVTAPDIIFFWVARMIMATKYLTNDIPFKDVYFTSLIRDGKGRKLSKSLGNSPDPLNIIARYGADAVRFTMIYLSPLGQDVRMDVNVETQDIPSVEMGRNFCNKIWNAARFLMMKQDQFSANSGSKEFLSKELLSFSDRWILSRLNSTILKIDEALIDYRVNEYSKLLYDFIWRDFCDWYVEIIKIQSNSGNETYNKQLLNSAIDIFENILKLIHPAMPFITEEIWHLMSERNQSDTISKTNYPKVDTKYLDLSIEVNFELVQNIVEEVRKLRTINNVPVSQKLPIIISVQGNEYFELLNQLSNVLKSLTRASELEIKLNASKPDNSISTVYRDIEIHIISDFAIDIEGEIIKLTSEIDRISNLIKGSESKLNNDKFVEKAKAEVVLKEKEKLESLKSQFEILTSNLKRISN